MSRKRTKTVIDIIPGYTAKQSQFIRGEIGVDELDGRFFRHFLKNAIAAKDDYLIETAQNLLDFFKEEARERNHMRARERNRRLYNSEEIVWSQPKSTEYTEHQKKIIRDEIPIDSVHTNELVSICKKAKAAGDTELYDMIYEIISERRDESRQKSIVLNKDLKRLSDKYDDFKNRDYLTPYEEAVLTYEVDRDELSTEHLEHIVEVVRKSGDENKIAMAEQILNYRKNPESIYVTNDVDEAISIYEKIIGLPFRRLNTWFAED